MTGSEIYKKLAACPEFQTQFPMLTNYGTPVLEIDSFAICINGYQMGFGDALSKKQTADKLLWMYEEHLNTLKNIVENLSQ